MKRIAKDLGFRSCPVVKFKDIDLRDEVQLMRVATRLMELGILTAEQGMNLFHTGSFPDAEDLPKAQEKFIKEREKGYYNPIIGGVPLIEQQAPEIQNNQDKKEKPTKGMSGRPEGSKDQFSRENIQGAIYKIEALHSFACDQMKSKLNCAQLSDVQEKAAW